MISRERVLTGTVAAGIALMVACGGDNGGSPSGPSGGGGGTTGPSGATITIGADGRVSPADVTINVGQSVTFVNNHTSGHPIQSDPHPAHTDCPAINALGTIAAGQTRLTNAFTAARTCGFHDHDAPSNAGLQGSITIR